MDIYRRGELKGPEEGAFFSVDYSSASQERKRLCGRRVTQDRKFEELIQKLESGLTT